MMHRQNIDAIFYDFINEKIWGANDKLARSLYTSWLSQKGEHFQLL